MLPQLATNQMPGNEVPRIPLFVSLIYMTAGILAPLLAVNCRFDLLIFKANPSPSLAKLDLWLGMVGVQAISWAIIATWIIAQVRDLVKTARAGRTLWVSLLCTAILLLPFLVSAILEQRAGIPPDIIARVPINRYFGILGAIFDAAVIFVLFLAYGTAIEELSLQETSIVRIIRFSERLYSVQQLFIAASIVLGLGVIGTAAQRNAIEADHKGTFPPEYVVLFGLVGSLVLLAAFAQIQLDLHRRGKVLIEEVSGPIPTTANELKAWMEVRSSFESLLGQDLASVFGLGGALPLLLPVVIGSVTKLMAGY